MLKFDTGNAIFQSSDKGIYQKYFLHVKAPQNPITRLLNPTQYLQITNQENKSN
jgi:hypothetical protein